MADNKINGAFIVSADRHRSDAWKIERSKGYPLYEFMSSRLTNIHTHAVQKNSLFGYSDKCSFGKLNFDLTKKDPTVTYEIFNIDNEKIHDLKKKVEKDWFKLLKEDLKLFEIEDLTKLKKLYNKYND